MSTVKSDTEALKNLSQLMIKVIGCPLDCCCYQDTDQKLPDWCLVLLDEDGHIDGECKKRKELRYKCWISWVKDPNNDYIL